MSTILVIVPDYASHYLPVSVVAAEMAERGHTIVMATGRAMAERARVDGYNTLDLALGPGANPGLIRATDQSEREATQLNDFFEASKAGPVATLLHQAHHRINDLLWNPMAVAGRIQRLFDISPDMVLVDHLAFGATAALRGLGIPFVSFHPGHPAAVASGSLYGMPPRFPRRLNVSSDQLRDLEILCRNVGNRFTEAYNEVIETLGSSSAVVADAFAASGEMTLINYPRSIGRKYQLPPEALLIGSTWRLKQLPMEMAMRLSRRTRRPRIYISLGSFFSARADLLRKLVRAFERQDVDVVMASGITDVTELGDVPPSWTVEPFLPQTAVLTMSDLVVTHGGNNTVTEAFTAGVPMLVGPLSTDQFSGAVDVEESGLGMVFDPNADSPATIAEMAQAVLASDAPDRSKALSRDLLSRPGATVAADLLESHLLASVSVDRGERR